MMRQLMEKRVFRAPTMAARAARAERAARAARAPPRGGPRRRARLAGSGPARAVAGTRVSDRAIADNATRSD